MSTDLIFGGGIVALFLAYGHVVFTAGRIVARLDALETGAVHKAGPIAAQINVDHEVLTVVRETQTLMVERLEGIKDAVTDLTVELRTTYQKLEGQ